MRVGDIMKRDVKFASRRTTLQDAARRMRDCGVGFLPVIGDDFRVLGVVTDRDLVVRALANGATPETPVEEVMTRGIVAVRPDDDLAEVERKMTQWKKGRILVLDEWGLCCGVLSLADLARQRTSEAAQVLSSIAAREVR